MKAKGSLLLRTVLLLLLAGIAAGALNYCRRDGLPWYFEWVRHVETRARQAGVPLIGLHSMRLVATSVSTRILDARPTADFRAGHIPRAVSLPFDHAEILLVSMQLELPREQPIITYCARNDCDEGLDLALFLHQIGYTNVSLFSGGLAEWRAGGGVVEVEP